LLIIPGSRQLNVGGDSLFLFLNSGKGFKGRPLFFPKLATPAKAFSRELGAKCDLAGDFKRVPFFIAE
jgi:hypothetical protein